MITLETWMPKYFDIWKNHLAGVLDPQLLIHVKDEYVPFLDRRIRFYECPCGGDDHYAMRSQYPEDLEFSNILNCFYKNLQWFVKDVDIAGMIRKEEESFIKLLEKSGPIIDKITAKMGENDRTVAYLYDTHGIPEDVVRDYWR